MQKIHYKNHIIKKKWGQIFLTDQNIINSIINIFQPQHKQTIIEIGPGLGALTQPILNVVDFLIVIERDPQLTQKLFQNFNTKKLKIFNTDVMKINFFNLIPLKSNQKIRLIGNLPYNIATQLIVHLFKYTKIIYDMHFMLQKEVGKRIIAQPNSKEYGRLSIMTQYHYQVSSRLEVSKQSFIPIPKVESMIIQFTPYHAHFPYPIVDIRLLSFLTKIAFHQRRKIIKNSLSSLFNTKEMQKCGLDTTLRSENLTIQQFCMLAEILHNKC
ncbi:dimethyladenosine transferase [Candidatus Blochmanniella vafra str. BVAF]|uniref:Ribosomal RNA small subunit methyltransferase A n=1 Tax=Blochmanniella vafra (strain BVAF) TaxID=859654 RepID=E8Q5N7_BLOVB|nr:16S rRNA (adenine(1518)-N(6)/adenine(1519)-N(6))-dimethyltransferase RsmA [Candidatus Blochmannia vafer]ADV33534.1 dimethyladenosine transferase [Candidatus Blochmannia vafer str. BVAF]